MKKEDQEKQLKDIQWFIKELELIKNQLNRIEIQMFRFLVERTNKEHDSGN